MIASQMCAGDSLQHCLQNKPEYRKLASQKPLADVVAQGYELII